MLRRFQNVSPKLEAAVAAAEAEALPAEAERVFVPIVERRNAPPFRSIARGGLLGLTPGRLALIFVALAAAGMAAYLATSRETPVAAAAAAPAAVAPAQQVQVLVAKDTIGIGEKLSPASMEWEDWPGGNIRPDYVTVAATPDALDTMSGSVARFEFFPGEPIRAAKLSQPTDGFLSAVLDSGMRGVSVSVNAESASGGFVVPNDHVDVVLTRAGDNDTPMSETIVRNVRVLAINTRLGQEGKTGAPPDPNDPTKQVFTDKAIATLELTPDQAETIINATTIGKLSLELRSLTDFPKTASASDSELNASIRINSPFWTPNAGIVASAK